MESTDAHRTGDGRGLDSESQRAGPSRVRTKQAHVATQGTEDGEHGDETEATDRPEPAFRGLSPGEQVLCSGLTRDCILKHLNPRKLGDLQRILEFRGLGVLSDEELKSCFERLWGFGESDFALSNWEEMSIEGMVGTVKRAHPCLETTGEHFHRVFPRNCMGLDTLKTKEDVLREYGMLRYIPKEVYTSAVGGVHVLQELGQDAGMERVCTSGTCLEWSCEASLPESTVLAILNGSNGRYIDEGLRGAATGRHFSLVIALIEAGYRARIGCCLSEAASLGEVDALRRLLDMRGGRVKATDEDLWAALHCAAQWGHVEAARVLVEHGADLNGSYIYGTTALHYAVQEDHAGMVCFLVEHGANINATDKERWTPLHFAAHEGRLDIARILVNHRANVNAIDRQGRTALHHAAYGRHMDIVEFLVAHDADIHVRDLFGGTAVRVVEGQPTPTFLPGVDRRRRFHRW